MSTQPDRLDPIIEHISAELRDALITLRRRTTKPGGRKITVHISEDWAKAFIELPPEVIRIVNK